MRKFSPSFSHLGLLLILIVAAAAQSAQAQSSIFNVPSTDVQSPQTFYVEADYIAHPAPYDEGGFHYFGPSVIYGVREDFEVGLNAYYTLSAEPGEAELQPNAKWRFYNNEGKGVAAAAGALLIIPLAHRATTSTKAIVYANVSKQLEGRLAPRITSGAYSFVGRMDEGESRAGLLLGLEQPLHRKLTFVADWYSGHNSYGYAAAGIGITLSKKNLLYAGYNFGNEGRGNNWLGIYFGRTF